jgi:dihydropyrimidinase
MDVYFDLVIRRHADIATAADRFEADIGIAGRRIVALGAGAGAGAVPRGASATTGEAA